MLDAGLCAEVRAPQPEVGDLEDRDSFGAHPFCKSALSRVKFYKQDPPCGIDANGVDGRVPQAGSGGGGWGSEDEKCGVAVCAAENEPQRLAGPTCGVSFVARCDCARVRRALRICTFSAAAFSRLGGVCGGGRCVRYWGGPWGDLGDDPGRKA